VRLSWRTNTTTGVFDVRSSSFHDVRLGLPRQQPRLPVAVVVALVVAAAGCGPSSGHAKSPTAASAISAGASGATTSLSIRQVYESNDPDMTGTLVPDGADSPAPPPSASASETPQTTPSAADVAFYASTDCSRPLNQRGSSAPDDPIKFLVACGTPDGTHWYKYLLNPALIQHTDVASARATLVAGTGTQWSVLLTFTTAAAARWATFTAHSVGKDIAVVVDGLVNSAEVIEEAILGGIAQITGNFSEKSATELATALQR
jgi:preprotein translocase subunit SecD